LPSTRSQRTVPILNQSADACSPARHFHRASIDPRGNVVKFSRWLLLVAIVIGVVTFITVDRVHGARALVRRARVGARLTISLQATEFVIPSEACA
jgi:hypothetical protein